MELVGVVGVGVVGVGVVVVVVVMVIRVCFDARHLGFPVLHAGLLVDKSYEVFELHHGSAHT